MIIYREAQAFGLRVTRWVKAAQRGARFLLGRADALFNALYTWRFNPLYHTGALVVASFLILAVTGVYLLLLYRIGAPYESVARLTAQPFAGRWIRTLHRYVSDLAIVAIVVHALRMFAQDHAWGPRARAWVSGVVLTVVFLVCGWTGYVMVWDSQAQLLATAGARLLDILPVFAGPIARAFTGEREIPNAFFFLNLFAHIAIPVGIALILWIHVSRLARPHVMPPRPLLWGVVALFTALSIAWPVTMSPQADLLRLPTEVVFDVLYGFWLPFTQSVSVGWAWVGLVGVVGAALGLPYLTRPTPADARDASWVNPRLCTGCEQCYHDCPYEAISMVRREDGREGFIAFVDPGSCVSCGICAGSCAPMVVGPPGRTGRDQLEDVRAFITAAGLSAEDVVLVVCRHSAAGGGAPIEGAPAFPVSCVGAMHSSVVEYLVRAGAGGVLIVSCPPRDCWNREGVAWLLERTHHGREAELRDRVDRRRVSVVYAAEREGAALAAELDRFRRQVRRLEGSGKEHAIDIDDLCVPPEVLAADATVP
mgnify:FL=1